MKWHSSTVRLSSKIFPIDAKIKYNKAMMYKIIIKKKKKKDKYVFIIIWITT